MKPTGKRSSTSSIAKRSILNRVFCVARELLTVFLLLLFAQVALSPPAQAQAPGDLDSSFGVGGLVTTHFFGGNDVAISLALQPDGKIVVGGRATHPVTENDFALARYNGNGGLDASFGSGGKVTTDFFGRIRRTFEFPTDNGLGVALQPDGKIVLTGWAFDQTTGYHPALARYNTDGTLDDTFGLGGKLISDFPGKFDSGLAVALKPDGKIVIAGTFGRSVEGSGPNMVDFALARYNADGTLDDTFGSGGLVTTDFSGGIDEAWGVAVQSDGRIVVAGFANRGPGLTYEGPGHLFADFALARYNPDGSLDASFGNGGKATADFGADDVGSGLALQPDGKIVVSGSTTDPALGRIAALARYNADGSLDATFGSEGKVTGSFRNALAVALQPDGKIVTAGVAASPATGLDFAVARYHGD